MTPSQQEWLKRLPVLFEIPAPDPQRLLRRIEIMERNVMLPVKAVFIGMILHSFHSTAWTGLELSMSELMVNTVQFVFWFYMLANVLFAATLVFAHICRWPWCSGRWSPAAWWTVYSLPVWRRCRAVWTAFCSGCS